MCQNFQFLKVKNISLRDKTEMWELYLNILNILDLHVISDLSNSKQNAVQKTNKTKRQQEITSKTIR